MLYKCNYCDPTVKRGQKPVKSIDTETQKFVKDEKGKYYHLECFRTHLTTRKKINNEEVIDQIIKELVAKAEKEVKENTEKDAFLKWIMEFYDGSLNEYFLTKLNNIRIGKFKNVNEPITYATLLDIYQYMERYLQKIAAKNNINGVSERMNYDLAVVIGNYGDYKKFKRKQHAFSIDKQEVDKQIEVDNKLLKMKEKVSNETEKDSEFDITDIIGELLL